MRSQTPVLVLLLLLSPSLFFANDSLQTTTTKAPRIVGGEIVSSPNPYPWVVHLSVECGSRVGVCGGSLLASDTVLTAAHCFDFSCDLEEIQVYASIGLDSENFEKTLRVRAFGNHPDFPGSCFQNDVAVWFLDGGFEIDTYATMAEEEIDVGTSVTVVGWGYTSENGTLSRELREVSLEIESNSVCRDVLGCFDDDSQLCAGASGKDTCQGDSGGPLFRGDSTIYGITSFGEGCARTDGAGYTLVSEYGDWVEAIIKVYRGEDSDDSDDNDDDDDDDDDDDSDSDSPGSVRFQLFLGGWLLVLGSLFGQF